MTRICALLIGAGLIAAGCSDKTPPTGPSPNTQATFTATLLPANETTAVSAPENSGSGTATITLNVTRDSNGNINAAVANFQVSLSNFPATANFTAAHIHEGGSGVAGPIKVSTGLASGEVVLVNGAASFTKSNINVPFDIAQNLLNNAGNYYFNIHTTANGGGVARGQLSKQ